LDGEELDSPESSGRGEVGQFSRASLANFQREPRIRLQPAQALNQGGRAGQNGLVFPPMPRPIALMLCGLPAAVLVKVRVVEAAPTAVGTKSTDTP
jgi:hypothetical protein